jgi:transcription elongation factor Elf1
MPLPDNLAQYLSTAQAEAYQEEFGCPVCGHCFEPMDLLEALGSYDYRNHGVTECDNCGARIAVEAEISYSLTVAPPTKGGAE